VDQTNDDKSGKTPSIARDVLDPSQVGIVMIKLTPAGDGELNVQCGIQNVDKKLARTAMIQSLVSLDAQIRAEELRPKSDLIVARQLPKLPKHGRIL